MNSMQRLQVATLLPVFALAGLAVVAFLNQLALTSAQNNRYESQMLAQELRASSDELTRLDRSYVVTGEPQHETEYWRILDVRNGVKPRADGQTVALRKLMELQGFTGAEFAEFQPAVVAAEERVSLPEGLGRRVGDRRRQGSRRGRGGEAGLDLDVGGHGWG